jgi:hypothetical protein
MSTPGRHEHGAVVPSVLFAALAAITQSACGAGSEASLTYYVDVATGSDANPGTSSQPFRTIVKALGVARHGQVVQVAPGTYGGASGEGFPLVVPAGVTLRGDEATKGAGDAPTEIRGGGLIARGPYQRSLDMTGTVDLKDGSTISGFTIANDVQSTASYHYALVVLGDENFRGAIVPNDHVTIRNNTVTGALHDDAILLGLGGDHHLIAGNRIVDNVHGGGILFTGGGLGSNVEDNVITGNGIGIEFRAPGGDLGGGSAGSAGGNVISCNRWEDLAARNWPAAEPYQIAAASNFWDRVPPEASDFHFRPDISVDPASGITVATAGAKVAPRPCLEPSSGKLYSTVWDGAAPNTLIIVDPGNGRQVAVGPSGLTPGQQALAWDPVSRQLLGLDPLGFPGQIARLDPSTGEAAPAAVFAFQLTGITVSPAGQIYVLSNQSSLLSVELANLTVSRIGDFDAGVQVVSLDFCADGTLYGIQASSGADGLEQWIITLDPATAGMTSTVPVQSQLNIGDIACGPDGDLYATNASWALLRIDPRTGEVLVAGFGQLGALGGLAFVPSP